MKEIIATSRPYLEVLYFIVGILLIGGLGLAYRQLRLIKEDIGTRNRRAAAEKAIQACETYFNSYVPLSGILFRERLKSNMTTYSGPFGDFSKKSLPTQRVKDCLLKLSFQALPAMNQLEAIAACFTTGVADEATGFKVIGRTYCSTVENSYDVISSCRDGDAHDYWSNIVELYALWRPRLKKSELDLAKRDIEKAMMALSDKTISAIGTPGYQS